MPEERQNFNPDSVELSEAREVKNMSLANIVEIAVILAVIVVAIRFFVKRA